MDHNKIAREMAFESVANLVISFGDAFIPLKRLKSDEKSQYLEVIKRTILSYLDRENIKFEEG